MLFPQGLDTETISILLERQRVIAKTRLKAWISWLLPFLDPLKKGFKGQVHSLDHILQNLRWHLS
jgi:hypothetical protein